MAGRSTIRKIVNTSLAAKPVGPYSQAVIADNTIYVSGQIPLHPETGEMVEGGIKEQAEQVLKNLKGVVEGAGSKLGNVVKTTILLKNIADWPKVNEVYEKYFTSNYPARAAYAVADLPKGALVEIEAIAILGEIKDEK